MHSLAGTAVHDVTDCEQERNEGPTAMLRTVQSANFSATSPCMAAAAPASTWAVASSSTTILGRRMSRRARHSCCCCPVDRPAPPSPSRSDSSAAMPVARTCKLNIYVTNAAAVLRASYPQPRRIEQHRASWMHLSQRHSVPLQQLEKAPQALAVL